MRFHNQIRKKHSEDWGSIYLTAKRSVYEFADIIIADPAIDAMMGYFRRERGIEELKPFGIKVENSISLTKTFFNRRERRAKSKKNA